MAGARSFEHRLFEPAAQRGDRNPLDHLGAEGIGQQIARGFFREAPAAQVEDLLAVELADGRAVRALHVVGKDLELRQGVDHGRPVSSRFRLDCAESLFCAPGRTITLPLKTACAAPSTMHLCSCRLVPCGFM